MTRHSLKGLNDGSESESSDNEDKENSKGQLTAKERQRQRRRAMPLKEVIKQSIVDDERRLVEAQEREDNQHQQSMLVQEKVVETLDAMREQVKGLHEQQARQAVTQAATAHATVELIKTVTEMVTNKDNA